MTPEQAADKKKAAEIVDSSSVTVDDVWTHDEEELVRDIAAALEESRRETAQQIAEALRQHDKECAEQSSVTEAEHMIAIAEGWR